MNVSEAIKAAISVGASSPIIRTTAKASRRPAIRPAVVVVRLRDHVEADHRVVVRPVPARQDHRVVVVGRVIAEEVEDIPILDDPHQVDTQSHRFQHGPQSQGVLVEMPVADDDDLLEEKHRLNVDVLAACEHQCVGRLDGKAALVTGGSRGIGRAIVERLASDGARVVFSYATNRAAAEDVAAAVAAAGGEAIAFQADLAQPDAARILYDAAESECGPLDTLVNNAGIGVGSTIDATTDDEFDATMNVNLRAPFVLMREAAKRMRDDGRIVNISTLNTVLASGGIGPYAASKAALEMLGRVVSYELGPRGTTVNAVLPGATDTDMFTTSNPSPDAHEQIAAMTALRRIGQPADVADVVAFLAGPDARWVTGQSIRATGGLA